MKALFRRILPLLILMAALLGVALLIATKPKPAVRAATEQVWPVALHSVRLQTLAPGVLLYGQVESPDQAVLSAALGAEVRAVPVRAGQQVAAQTVLVQFDDQEVRLLLAQRAADLAELDAQLEAERLRQANDQLALEQDRLQLTLARSSVARVRQLLKSQAMAQTSLDEALQAEARQVLAVQQREYALREHPIRLAQLEARRQRAQALRAQAALDLSRTELRAPYPAVITQVQIAAGARVRLGDPLLTLYPQNRLEIRAQLPQGQVPRIQAALAQNQTLTAQLDSPALPLRLHLDRLAQRQNQTSGGRDAHFYLDAPADLAIGQPVSLWLTLPPVSGVFSAPASALYGLDRVYQVVDDRLRSVPVEYWGQYRDPATPGTQVLLKSSQLTEGAQLLAMQLPNAANGLKVQARSAP